MKLPIAFAALFLAATAALPAFAATPTHHALSRHDAAAPRIEAVRPRYGYWNGYDAYAAAPRGNAAVDGWGHCVSGLDSSAMSAYPSWDVCR